MNYVRRCLLSILSFFFGHFWQFNNLFSFCICFCFILNFLVSFYFIPCNLILLVTLLFFDFSFVSTLFINSFCQFSLFLPSPFLFYLLFSSLFSYFSFLFTVHVFFSFRFVLVTFLFSFISCFLNLSIIHSFFSDVRFAARNEKLENRVPISVGVLCIQMCANSLEKGINLSLHASYGLASTISVWKKKIVILKNCYCKIHSQTKVLQSIMFRL